MNEQFYITGLHHGDEQVFRELFDKYHSRLCYFASSLLTENEDAEDVVQEAFIRLWQRRNHFSDLSSVKAFLYISVKNRCLNIFRHDKVRKKYGDLLKKEELPDVQLEGAIHYLIEAEVLEKIRQAVESLPSGCRNIMNLSYFEGLKNQDIADQLHVSINTVKTQKKRGLQLLRALLKASSFTLFLPLLHYFF